LVFTVTSSAFPRLLSGADQGRGKGADQCCSADAKKEFLGLTHSLGF
jgi:hypothetical protein